ncbi:MAG: anhydro-N-acetylmuramic acid kinase [Alphaproteobacteria bacterium]|nr:anhydro-N-acetylmuramic acid kinase [Alphaproteobacteria bacterium]
MANNAKRRVWRALGLMSGTSLDGVDAALIETDGERVHGFGPWLTRPYDAATRELIRSTFGDKGPIALAERALTEAHAAAIEKLLAEHSIARREVDLIGFHGQTIDHRPDLGRTRQIGDGGLLARLTGIDVVNDFRSADMRAGGQGAPLAPLYHAALAAGLEKPLAVLNIGGVANVTWIGSDDGLLAFDTGPGGAPIDDWMLRHTGKAFDRDGETAARGQADRSVIDRILKLDYYRKIPPKALDRNAFSDDLKLDLSLEDGAATLTVLTAAAAAAGLRHLPKPPRRWLVTGGGRHNPSLMAALRRELGVPVDPVEAVGWRGDALEAEAFAFLAVRSRLGLPLSLPGTTGVSRPTTGGAFHPAARSEQGSSR